MPSGQIDLIQAVFHLFLILHMILGNGGHAQNRIHRSSDIMAHL